jgi:thiol-disulfide isomerase/thioredoxin
MKSSGTIYYYQVALIAIFLSCQTKAVSQEYQINVKLAGNVNGKKVYLKNSDRTIVDSSLIEGGALQFKGKIKYPTLYTLTIMDKRQPNPNYQPVIPIFLESSKVHVSASLDSLSNEVNFRNGQYNYSRVKVEGSSAHKVYVDYLKGYDPLFAVRKVAFRKYLDYLNSGDSENASVSEGIELVSKVDKAAKKRDDYIKQYIKDHPKSLVSVFIASDNLNPYSVDEIDDIVASLSPDVLKTDPGKSFLQRANQVKKSAAGAMYTNLSFKDDKGTVVQLSDYVAKGKYVLLEFWASWCVPCRADIPHLKKNYSLYHPEGFEVISVSMDDKKDSWLKAVKEEQMDWLQLSDLKAFKGAVSNVYNFSGVPTCILIDPKGRILTRNMRGSWMDKRLIEIYGNKFKSK